MKRNSNIDDLDLLLIIVFLLMFLTGCAKPSERYVRCAPYIAADGTKGFWDLEMDVPVDGHVCNEVIVQ